MSNESYLTNEEGFNVIKEQEFAVLQERREHEASKSLERLFDHQEIINQLKSIADILNRDIAPAYGSAVEDNSALSQLTSGTAHLIKMFENRDEFQTDEARRIVELINNNAGEVISTVEKINDEVIGSSLSDPAEYENFQTLLTKSIDQVNRFIYTSEEINAELSDPRTCGLALSGGGVRSATFNLGILQALHEKKLIPQIDYLSTVSGGGYIGTSITYFNNAGVDWDKDMIDYLRGNAAYLTPGSGINKWALMAAVIRGTFINLSLMLSGIYLVIWLLTRGCTGTLGGGLTTLNCNLPQLSLFSAESNILNMDKNNLDNGWFAILIVLAAYLIPLVVRRLFNRMDNAVSDEIKPVTGLYIAMPLCLLVASMLILFSSYFRNHWEYLLIAYPIAVVFTCGLIAVWQSLNDEQAITEDSLNLDNTVKYSKLNVHTIVLELLAWGATLGVVNILIEYTSKSWNLTWYPPLMLALAGIGLAILIRLLVSSVFYAGLSSAGGLNLNGSRYFSIQYGDFLWLGTLLLSFGLIPLVHYLILHIGQNLAREFLTSVSAAGLISTLIGWLTRSKGNELKGYVAVLLRLGLILLFTSGLLWAYDFTTIGPGSVSWKIALLVLVILIIASVITDINYVSLHRYYRNRLVDSFLKKCNISDNKEHDAKAAVLKSVDIGKSGAPYPLINTNIVTVGSSSRIYGNRLGDSFTFSPKYLGSTATGWVATDAAPAMNLGTAMAISGAAVDPNIGETRSWPLRIVMGLLNIRLGYWLMSPKHMSLVNQPNDPEHLGRFARLYHESWIALQTREIMGFPRENWKYVRLSDGGHFENLGLYELVRRRCRVIIISDAGADPQSGFSDLSRAVERVRVDFGADVKIENQDQIPDEVTKSVASAFVTGTISYRPDSQDSVNEGLLIYIKTARVTDMPVDVKGYAFRNPSFPDESTTDQFFSEDQFEAYRMLGYHIGHKMLEKLKDEIQNALPKYIAR